MIIRPPLATLAAATFLALAGCGEDREGSVESEGGSTATTETGKTGTKTEPATPSGAVVATVKVKETEYALAPKNPRVARAGVVEFRARNAGKVTHALEVEGPSGEVETDAIEPGKTAKLRADLSKPGRYTWYCPIGDHKDRGMKGKVTVGAGRSGGGGGSGSRKRGGGGGGAQPDTSGSGGKRDGAAGGVGGY